MNLRTLSLIPLALIAAAANAQTAAPAAAVKPAITLHIGDAAPELTIVKWLKGTPQTTLTDGKVRVIEFWATWCGPCKVGMPHLSELAKHYGDKVAFVGVDGSESKDDVALAEKFVSKAGDMMAYNVAYATPRGAMTENWMRAAGQNGIPCAFVVDKHGKIGWIGHPLMGLEDALDLAVEDKLTPDAAAQISKDWEAKLAKGQEVYKNMAAAMKDDKTDEALKLNEQVMENLPYMVTAYAANKYSLLTAKSPAEAAAYGKSLLTEKANAPLVLQAVAQTILMDSSSIKGDRDYKLAQALLVKSLDCTELNMSSAQTLAKSYAKLGDKANAVKYQEEAIKMIPDVPQAAKAKEMATKTLEEYKSLQTSN